MMQPFLRWSRGRRPLRRWARRWSCRGTQPPCSDQGEALAVADRAASSPLHPSPIESAEYKVRLVWHFRTLCATFFYALH